MAPGALAPVKEIPHIPVRTTRVTKQGRKITYVLKVIQEPERARACGSGAKSSADRRPVDPPPVVELRIYEGDGEGPANDITFSYEANFFLFATLEVARPIANGRLPHPPAPQVPVLTGMPVSGMAYLDRPSEAGYFIFPDLSVRHEGKYRLSFNLYEETKYPSNDGDAEPSNESKPKIPSPGAPESSFDWRLEVKSIMFMVYSAKKFPGLAESTVLSRTVAEQGCRVRIRRDVRMRRREGKSGGDYDDPVEQDDYARPGRPAEQEPYREGSRSHTGSPEAAERSPYQDPNRRMSGEFQPQQYPGFSPSPVSNHAPPPPGGNLGWIDQQRAGPQYAAPQPHFAQPPTPSVPQPYQAPQPAYHQPPAPQSLPQYRGPPGQNNNYPPYERGPQSAFPSNPPREQRDQQFDEYRRASAPYPLSSAPANSQYPSMESNYNRPQYQPFRPPHSPVSLPPLKMTSIDSKFENMSSPPGPLPSIAPPMHSPNYERAPERSSSYAQPPAAPLPTLSEVTRNGKRAFDDVFSSSASSQPLYNGMRPSSSHQAMNEDDDQQLDSMDHWKMQYRRADGTNLSRELPALE